MITSFIFLHIGISLLLFIFSFLYANKTAYRETYLEKNWDLVDEKFKNQLKQNYLISKHADKLLIRLKFLDRCFFKNSIYIEPVICKHKKSLIKFSGRTDLKPFGFVFFLLFSFVFYIGAIYLFFLVKRMQKREMDEIRFVETLSCNI